MPSATLKAALDRFLADVHTKTIEARTYRLDPRGGGRSISFSDWEELTVEELTDTFCAADWDLSEIDLDEQTADLVDTLPAEYADTSGVEIRLT